MHRLVPYIPFRHAWRLTKANILHHTHTHAHAQRRTSGRVQQKNEIPRKWPRIKMCVAIWNELGIGQSVGRPICNFARAPNRTKVNRIKKKLRILCNNGTKSSTLCTLHSFVRMCVRMEHEGNEVKSQEKNEISVSWNYQKQVLRANNAHCTAAKWI